MGNYEFEPKNVKASIVKLEGEDVIKVERDLKALPFDLNRLENTVDEPTFIELKNIEFENGVIEVKMLSQIQEPSPFKGAQGFIGVAFRITENDKAYCKIPLYSASYILKLQQNEGSISAVFSNCPWVATRCHHRIH